MKFLRYLLLASIFLPSIAFAQLNTHQGGTGLIDISSGSVPFGSLFNIRLATSSNFQFNSTASRLTVSYASTTGVTAGKFFGALVGNADTASALAANGTNCSAGSFPLGIDASGNVENCTAAITLSSFSSTFPITYSAGAIGFGGLSTSTAAVQGNLPYFSGVNTFANVATTTLSFSGPFTGASALGALIGGSASTVLYTGLATTSQPSSSNLLTSNGGAGVYGTATSTLSASSPLTGSFTQVGSGGSIGCTTATGAAAGCLATADFNAFNGKLGTSTTLTEGALLYSSGGFPPTVSSVATNTLSGGGPITVSNNPVILGGSAATLGCNTATRAAVGCLAIADFNTFSNKIGTSTASETAGQLAYFTTTSGTPALITGVATGTVSAGSTAVTVTAGRSAIGGALAIDCAASSGSQAGCLSGPNFTTFNINKIGTSSSIAAGAAVLYATGINTVASAATNTLAGTDQQLAISNSPFIIGGSGAVISLPNHVKFPTDYEASAGTTTSATSTNFYNVGSSTIAGAFNSPFSNMLGSTTFLGFSLFGNATGTTLSLTGSSTIGGAHNSVVSNFLGSSTLLGNTLFSFATGTVISVTGSSTIGGAFNALTAAQLGSTTLWGNSLFVSATSTNLGLTSFKGCNTTSALTTTAAGSVVCGAISGSGVTQIVGGTGLNGGTITSTGRFDLISYLATSTAETAGNLAAWGSTNGTPAKLYSIATSSPTFNGGLTTSGTAGNWVGGSAYTISLANVNANSLLGCVGSPACTPTSVATSSLFTGTTGQLDYFSSSGGLVGTSSLFISTAQNLGVGSTTPWALLSVSSATTRPLFAVSTSTGAFGELFNISATTSVLGMISTAVQAASADIGARVGVGLSSYLGSGGLLDQFVVRGRTNTQDWNQAWCDSPGSVTGTGGTNICNGWGYGENEPVGGMSVTVINSPSLSGYAPFYRFAGLASLNNAGALWADAVNGSQWLTAPTSTPVLEATFRFGNSVGSVMSTSTAYIGFLSSGGGGAAQTNTPPSDGCYFTASSTQVDWRAIARNSNAETNVDTGVGSSTNTSVGLGGFRRFRVEADNSHCDFYIQNTQTSSLVKVASINTNIPTAGLTGGVNVSNPGAAISNLAPVADIYRLRIWWRDFLPVN